MPECTKHSTPKHGQIVEIIHAIRNQCCMRKYRETKKKRSYAEETGRA